MIEKYFENLTPLTKLRLHEVTKIVLFSHIDQDSILVGINNKGQDVSANSTVIFTTVHTTVKVTDSNNQPIDGAEVSGTLKIYDILGREVAKLVNREQKPGFYKAVWNAGNYASGIYIYQLVTKYGNGESKIQQKKMLLMK